MTKSYAIPCIMVFLLLLLGPLSVSAVPAFQLAGNTGHVSSFSPEIEPGQRALFSDPQMIAQAPKVEIYVTSWCPYCKKATNYFESKGIPYVAYDIEKDPEAAARKAKLDTRGGVPFVVIRGRNTTHYIHGYSVEQFEYALSK